MPAGAKRGIILLLLLGGGFLLGLFALFSLRFSGGDVFPPYSSLRADPLGTKALFEALAALPPRNVRRNYRPLNRYRPRPGETLLLLGSERHLLGAAGEKSRRRIEELGEGGARGVVAFAPFSRPRESGKPSTAPCGKEAGRKKTAAEDTRKSGWDLALAWPEKNGAEAPGKARPVASDVPAGTLPSHSAVSFRGGNEWRTLYATADGAVVVERAFGSGSVVLLAESYLLSNEAMRFDRHPPFLAWLIGPATAVVFDESHLGITDSGGIMKLARRFGLHWFFVALLPLAALRAWHIGVPLVPPPQDDAEPAGAARRPDRARVEHHDLARGREDGVDRHQPEHGVDAVRGDGGGEARGDRGQEHPASLERRYGNVNGAVSSLTPIALVATTCTW